jgi:hypothetical protein
MNKILAVATGLTVAAAMPAGAVICTNVCRVGDSVLINDHGDGIFACDSPERLSVEIDNRLACELGDRNACSAQKAFFQRSQCVTLHGGSTWVVVDIDTSNHGHRYAISPPGNRSKIYYALGMDLKPGSGD